MESTQMFGVAEECHSSESGWTMYIGSPIHGDDSGDDDGDDDDDGQSDDHGDGDDDDDDDDDDDYANSYNHEDDSDDSMASDACSGPSHQGIAHYRQEEDYKHIGKYQFKTKAKKPIAMEKQKDGQRRRKEKKEEMVFMGKRDNNVSAQSGSKPRKNFWMGKRN